MSEIWSKEICPHCKYVNWVYLGDMADETAMIVEGYKCKNCHKNTIFLDEESFVTLYGDDSGVDVENTVDYIIETQQVRIEDGLENPR